MKSRFGALVCALAMAACGGGNQEASEPAQPSEAVAPADPAPADPAQPDDGQAVDSEVPPGLSVLTLLGNTHVAAPANVDMNKGKQLFEAFIASFIELAGASAAAADCTALTGAWSAWRIKIMPVLQTDFATIDAYAKSMSEDEQKAMQGTMQPHLEKMMPAMMKCAQDAGFAAEMKQLEADFQKLADANKAADTP